LNDRDVALSAPSVGAASLARPIRPDLGTSDRRRGADLTAALAVHHAVTKVLGCGADKEEVARQVLETIGSGLGWHCGVLFEVDEVYNILRPTVVWRTPGATSELSEAALCKMRFGRGDGLPGRVWTQGVPMFRQAPELDDGRGTPLNLRVDGLHSVMMFPVKTAAVTYGVVTMFSRDPLPASCYLRETWESLGRQLGEYFDRLRIEQALRTAEQRLDVVSAKGGLECEIAERRRVEAALVASEARFQTLYRSNIIGIVISDFTGRIKEANDEYLRIIGYSRLELEQGLVDWRQLTPLEWEYTDDTAIEKLCQGGLCSPYAKEYRRRDGERVPVTVSAVLLDRPRGEALGFVQDDSLRRKAEITLAAIDRDLERRVRERTVGLAVSEARTGQLAAALALSEHRLRTLAIHLQSVREEERTQLAREIHDVLGQELTGLKMDAAWVTRRLKQPEIARDTVIDRLNTMGLSIDSAITNVRRIATDLRPGALDDLGLVSALEWQAREFERRSGLSVRFVAPTDEVSVERDLATAIFRIFQELLTNIARHAEAHAVDVSVVVTADRLALEICDDGRGICEADLLTSQSLGLLGMRERAAAFGGTFSIMGDLGRGTVARVDMPRVAREVR
jgi:PAS domain S-box-containing protein